MSVFLGTWKGTRRESDRWNKFSKEGRMQGLCFLREEHPSLGTERSERPGGCPWDWKASSGCGTRPCKPLGIDGAASPINCLSLWWKRRGHLLSECRNGGLQAEIDLGVNLMQSWATNREKFSESQLWLDVGFLASESGMFLSCPAPDIFILWLTSMAFNETDF